MKQVFFLLAALILLAACSNPAEDPTSSVTDVSSTNQTMEKTTMRTIFTGEITNSIISDADSAILQLTLQSIQKIADPEDIVPAFETNGVILNVPIEKLSSKPETLTTGNTVNCTLKGLPVMTMSIPPQIPGNSIEKVELLTN
ncbi:hypothetical protein [Enterococcus sp. AZ109]|uniref:hypothetical protein n=1 Tax=Enterococcus sp. AZ109 TaxID=2774634 RepID=UPI003F214FFD